MINFPPNNLNTVSMNKSMQQLKTLRGEEGRGTFSFHFIYQITGSLVIQLGKHLDSKTQDVATDMPAQNKHHPHVGETTLLGADATCNIPHTLDLSSQCKIT